jgi:hypothetical protein
MRAFVVCCVYLASARLRVALSRSGLSEVPVNVDAVLSYADHPPDGIPYTAEYISNTHY